MMKNSLNLDICCKVAFSQINGIKKWGHRVRFIEKLPSSERAGARARANHAKIDAQEGCAMQLNVCARSRFRRFSYEN